MDDLDRALQQLRTMPVPISLASLESDVLMQIDAERRASALTTGPVLSLVSSLVLLVLVLRRPGPPTAATMPAAASCSTPAAPPVRWARRPLLAPAAPLRVNPFFDLFSITPAAT